MNILKEIEAYLSFAEGRKLALWGMGGVGKALYKQLKSDSYIEMKVDCFDNYNKEYPKADELEGKINDYFVIVTFVNGYEEAEMELKQMGYEKVRDYICLGTFRKIYAEFANEVKRIMVRADTIETRRMAFDTIDLYCGADTYASYFDYARYRSFELLAQGIRREYSSHELKKLSVAEAGVFQGDFAWIINKNFPECKMYLYDTFEGFGEQDMQLDVEHGYMSSEYMEKIKKYFGSVEKTPEDRMQMVRDKCQHPELLHFRKGYFPDTASSEKNTSWVFVSLDMDLYNPILEGILYFYPQLVCGGGIFVHDYNNKEFSGVRLAVSDAEKTLGYYIPKMPISDEGGTIVLLK